MNSQKAAYWIALAVFGLALHSEYKRGAFPCLHRTANHAGTALCRLVTHAEQEFAMARMLAGQPAFLADEVLKRASATELANARAELARQQAQSKVEILRDQARARADMMRAQIDVDRAQFEQFRVRTASQFQVMDDGQRRMVVVCPRTRARIMVHADRDLSDLDADLSDIEIGDSF